MRFSILKDPQGFNVVVPYKRLNATERSMYRLRKKLKYNIAKFEHAVFIAFTYDSEHLSRASSKDISRFFHDYRIALKRAKNNKEMSYAWKFEYGSKNQRPHFHAIVSIFLQKELAIKCWGKGFVHFEMMSDERKALNYITKYICKKTDGSPKRRFGTSRDLLKPDKSKWKLVETHVDDNRAMDAMLENYRNLGKYLYHERRD